MPLPQHIRLFRTSAGGLSSIMPFFGSNSIFSLQIGICYTNGSQVCHVCDETYTISSQKGGLKCHDPSGNGYKWTNKWTFGQVLRYLSIRMHTAWRSSLFGSVPECSWKSETHAGFSNAYVLFALFHNPTVASWHDLGRVSHFIRKVLIISGFHKSTWTLYITNLNGNDVQVLELLQQTVNWLVPYNIQFSNAAGLFYGWVDALFTHLHPATTTEFRLSYVVNVKGCRCRLVYTICSSRL